MTSYLNRISALRKTTTYTLDEEGFGDETRFWGYNDIKQIQLKYSPTRYYGGIYQCIVTSEWDEVTLSNRRYNGPADFEYQNESYSRFVHELHQKLNSASGVRFVSGMSNLRFTMELVGSLIFFPLILYVIFMFGQFLVGGLVVFILLFRLLPYYRKNKPRSYLPSDVPDDLMP